MGKTIQRYSLNAKQIHVLKLMYKFRFVTSSLLARYKGISRIASNKALKILLEQKYIGMHYDRSYKIQGKGAYYYLAPKALTLLKDSHQANEQVLHAMYKNKTVGQDFIDHNLDVYKVYLVLRDSYPGTFHIFTKSELADFTYFPETRPDLYLNRITPVDDLQDQYIVEVFSATSQPFVMKNRFKALLEHNDSGEWEAEAETDYPTILLVCPKASHEESLQAEIAKALDNAGIDELFVYTTTLKALMASNGAQKTIWSDAQDPKSLLSL